MPGSWTIVTCTLAAAVAQLAAQRLEHALHRVLGAAVGRLERDAAVGERRADLHDRAAVARQHPLERDLGAPHRAEIGDPGGALVLVRLDVVEEREHGGHRVVDPDVDRTQALLDRRRGGLHLVELGHVGRVGVGRAAELGDLLGGGVQPGAAARDQAHRGAVAGELAGDRAAHAARGAR